MRLRSSQLVFLMLLVCSVRVGEECVAQLAAAVARPSHLSAEERNNSPAQADPGGRQSPQPILTPSKQLGSADRAAHLAVWAMATPALASTAIVSYTSLLRA